MIEMVAKDVGLTKKQANQAVDSIFQGIEKELKRKKKVTLVGFGTFSVKKRKARKGINPQTGEAIRIKASKVPHFKPGAKFKQSVN
ncbi:HU family DNA-binding protein [candidate division WOR-3 bacterium]|nr:HU family DNA-binding protein [candidate division WOR-3 bacterium]